YGKATVGRPRSEPDWGKPTVRDRRGACGNVDHGGTRHAPRVSKERVLETLRLKLCAPQIYPDLPRQTFPDSLHAPRARYIGDHCEEMTMWRSLMGCIVILTLSILVAPLATDAQRPGKMARIGWLVPFCVGRWRFDPFWQAMRELGWVEG